MHALFLVNHRKCIFRCCVYTILYLYVCFYHII